MTCSACRIAYALQRRKLCGVRPHGVSQAHETMTPAGPYLGKLMGNLLGKACKFYAISLLHPPSTAGLPSSPGDVLPTALTPTARALRLTGSSA